MASKYYNCGKLEVTSFYYQTGKYVYYACTLLPPPVKKNYYQNIYYLTFLDFFNILHFLFKILNFDLHMVSSDFT